METPLTQQVLDPLCARLYSDQKLAGEYFAKLRQQLVGTVERRGIKSPEDLVDAAFNRAAQEVMSGRVFTSNLATYLLADIYQIAFRAEAAQGLPAEPLPSATTAPPLDHLRHHLQTHRPVLYARVLADTFADLRLERFDALAAGRPLKARWVLLRGCGALAAAATYQLGFSLLGRIAAIWQTRSPK